ncbi:MAG: hypothetical protein FWG21_06585, partial [Oscillospiraceae bacterium]|nr:hypothetical protein [Oscillospiraceae bacterium]
TDIYDTMCQVIDRRFLSLYRKLESVNTSVYELSQSKVSSAKASLTILAKTLNSLSPLNVLDRGYMYATKDDKQISSITEVELDSELVLVFKDGYVTVEVKEITKRI